MINSMRGAVQYSSTGFRRFFDDIVMHGLEIVGLYYGVYRAKVISRDDPLTPGVPDPQGRLTVHVPAVDGSSELTTRLAYPIVPLGGSQYGFKTLPPVHTDAAPSMVYVVFERGKVETPLWVGGWWRQNDMPTDMANADSHGWFTPGGHQILLDEQTGLEVIRIKHLDGETRLEFDVMGNIYVVNKVGSRIYIGDEADTVNEPVALGNTLKGLLETLIDEILALQFPTPAGLSGTPFPASVASLEALKAQLETILSQTIQVK